MCRHIILWRTPVSIPGSEFLFGSFYLSYFKRSGYAHAVPVKLINRDIDKADLLASNPQENLLFVEEIKESPFQKNEGDRH